ncbi:MAG: M24 family metallopeptidase, partial [Candidatus Levybacteria bacterium]|nr:M24 family metallopeptidase [Candidatus Levybacteria bacterium]
MTTPLLRVGEQLYKNKLDSILISSVSNIIYLTNYSGFSTEEREAYLLIGKNFQYILTDGRYTHAIKTLISDFKLIEISSKLSAKDALKKLIKKHKIKKLGFEGHSITHIEHKSLSKTLRKIYHIDLNSLRTIKTENEISKIEKACELGDKTFDYILKKIKLGVSEKELATEIEFFIKRNGGETSFRTIVAFGKNSAIPHHQTSDKRLAIIDKFVLLDFGVKLNNYCSDMTRTIFFDKPTTEQKKMYETVLEAQRLAISRCHAEFISASRPKGILKSSKRTFLLRGGAVQDDTEIKASEVDQIARKHIISKGYKTIPHSVGHGIGIDVHENPHLSPKS